jgi:hypothetical protein
MRTWNPTDVESVEATNRERSRNPGSSVPAFGRTTRLLSGLLVACSLLPLTLVAHAPQQPAMPTPVRFTALAVNMGTAPDLRMRASQSPVDITVERWSTDEEREHFFTALGQSPDTLLNAFQDAKRVGYLRTPDQLGYDLKYARQMPAAGGGTRVVLATDRPLGFWELANQTRTSEYPFTVIELRLDQTGKGEGKMSVATKITTEKDHTIVLENYLSEPVQLQDLKVAKK